MDLATRSQVRQRADFKCEYCKIPEAATPFIPFHVEHIVAQQHQQLTASEADEFLEYLRNLEPMRDLPISNPVVCRARDHIPAFT